MQLTTCDIVDQYLCRITVTAGKEEFEAACAKVAESSVGMDETDVWYEAVNACIDAEWNGLYQQAMSVLNITPMDDLSFALEKVDAEGFTAVVSVPVLPAEVELGGYRDMEVSAAPDAVPETMVDARVQSLWLRNYRLKDHAGPVVRNDVVIIDYKVVPPEGIVIRDPEAKNVEFTIGGNEPFVGLSNQLLKHCAGETVKCKVTATVGRILSGSTKAEVVDCECTLVRVCQKEFDQKDDAFVQRVTEYKTMAELRAALRKEQEQLEADKAKRNAQGDAVVRAAANLKAPELTDSIKDYYYDRFLDRLRVQALPNEGDFERYLQSIHMNPAQYRARVMPSIVVQIRERMMLLLAARAEKIVPTEEEMETEWARIAKAERCTVEEAKANHADYVACQNVQINKAVDIVRDTAKVLLLPPVERPQPAQQMPPMMRRPAPRRK